MAIPRSTTNFCDAMTTMAKMTATPNSRMASFDSLRCNGVPMVVPRNAPVDCFKVRYTFWYQCLFGSLEIRLSFPCSDLAILPISVSSPVRMTIPCALPLTTMEEEYARFSLSPTEVYSSLLYMIWSSLATGRDSPVSKASSVSKLWQLNSLKSAGTVSPTLTMTISPGTTSFVGMMLALPLFLITWAFGELSCFKEFIVFDALYSCMMPMTTFTAMTKVMTPPVIQSWMAKEMTIEMIRTRIMALQIWWMTIAL